MSGVVDASGLFFDARRERRIAELRAELENCPKSERMRVYRELQVAISCRSRAQVERMEIAMGLRRA